MNIKIKLTLIFLIILIFSCGSVILKSTWSDNIHDENWRKNLTFFEEEKISIGTINNQDELKIFIASNDRSKIMQFIGQGLTIWITKSTSNNDKIGIKYPIRKDDTNRLRMMAGNRDDDFNSGEMIEKIISEHNEFLVVNENNFPLGAYPLINETGIEPKLEFEMGQLIYSIKIPLNNSENKNFDVQYSPGEKMKIDFEIEELKSDRINPGNIGQGMGAGGRNPRSGGIPGGRRGGAINRMNRQEPLDISLEIQLAAK